MKVTPLSRKWPSFAEGRRAISKRQVLTGGRSASQLVCTVCSVCSVYSVYSETGCMPDRCAPRGHRPEEPSGRPRFFWRRAQRSARPGESIRRVRPAEARVSEPDPARWMTIGRVSRFARSLSPRTGALCIYAGREQTASSVCAEGAGT